jgi:hypothetical protein
MASIFVRLAGHVVLGFLIALASGAKAQAPVELQTRFMKLSAAADQGEPEAYFPLAQMYADGQGTPRDLIEAYALAEIAETVLNLPEDSDQERALALKQQLATQMTPHQIELAHRRAHEGRPDLEQIQRRPVTDLKALLAVLGGAVLLGIALRLLIQRAVFRH